MGLEGVAARTEEKSNEYTRNHPTTTTTTTKIVGIVEDDRAAIYAMQESRIKRNCY